MILAAAVLVFVACLRCEGAGGDEPVPPASGNEPKRWLLLCCGLPGDEVHRERLTTACEKLIASATEVLGVSSDELRVLVGDESMQEALRDKAGNLGICTSDSVAESMKLLSDQIGPEDECWVMLLGHSHLYGGSSQFNVQGKDFDQVQFAAWAQPLKATTQVFLLTMPVTGYWIKPLAREGRVIITATEADLEFTGTEMPYALADVLAGDSESQSLEDIDGDEVVSLLDLYLALSLEIDARFRSMDRLQTEHAQLEDNGDGRGSELQQPYLPTDDVDETAEDATEQAIDPADDTADAADDSAPSLQKTPRPPLIEHESRDGFRSRQILLQGSES